MNSTTAISLRVPTDLAELIGMAADSQGLSLGAFVREAIVAHADAHPGIAPELAAQLREASARIRKRPSQRPLVAAAGNGSTSARED